MSNYPLRQQGDVLIRRIEKLPAQAKAQPASGRIILAHGEVTGHAHTIEEQEGVRLYTLDELLYLVADHETTITHQEHGAVTIPAGVYQIGKVCEWDYMQEEARQVRD